MNSQERALHEFAQFAAPLKGGEKNSVFGRRGGTEGTLGVPIAFIESAWRRYTRHSNNKVSHSTARETEGDNE